MQEHFESLLQALESHGLTAKVENDIVDAESVGIVGREHEYEGGFVTVICSWP